MPELSAFTAHVGGVHTTQELGDHGSPDTLGSGTQ